VIRIELVYEQGSAGVAPLRATLAWAMLEARVSQRWTERVLPEQSGFTPPVIFVNGCKIGAPAHPDASLRYVRLPTFGTLVAVLKAAKAAAPDVPKRRRRRR
jgi:hypothetical protein